MRVKKRETTRTETWTLPDSDADRYDFLHGEEWDVLEVIEQVSKVLLIRYTRAEVIALLYPSKRDVRRSRSGEKVQIIVIQKTL